MIWVEPTSAKSYVKYWKAKRGRDSFLQLQIPIRHILLIITRQSSTQMASSHAFIYSKNWLYFVIQKREEKQISVDEMWMVPNLHIRSSS